MKRDLATPLAPTYGDPKKKPASANPQVGKKIAQNGGEFRSLEQEAKTVGYGKTLLKAVTRPEPKNSMWHDFPSYFKKKAKKTSTMHKTRNPKPGPYQY
jgi:hypothetical protein|tara:strand:- start:61 stop:357 length:297 start_codon:yes stop_codon:yes gene_type:complete